LDFSSSKQIKKAGKSKQSANQPVKPTNQPSKKIKTNEKSEKERMTACTERTKTKGDGSRIEIE
jgi:hypothetical protein